MPFIAWILLGLIAGFLGSRIANRSGRSVLFDIVLGVVGAVAGGFIFEQLGASNVSALNPWSLLVATTGAVFAVIAFHTVRRIGWSDR